jgi:hypothetical protein
MSAPNRATGQGGCIAATPNDALRIVARGQKSDGGLERGDTVNRTLIDAKPGARPILLTHLMEGICIAGRP